MANDEQYVKVAVKEMSLKMKLVFEVEIDGVAHPDQIRVKDFKSLPGENAPEFLTRVKAEISDRGMN